MLRHAWMAFALAAAAVPARSQVVSTAPHGSLRFARQVPIPPCDPGVPGSLAYDRSVDLSSLASCAATHARPWSAAYTPDGSALYVTALGGFVGGGGCLVAHLDPDTFAVVDTVEVGESPEEIAFTVRPNGRMRYGFATANSSSEVTVFDASDHELGRVALPFDPEAFFPTAFPFGLAVSPDQSRVYVGTLDGSGNVFVIDAEAHVLLPAETLNFGVGTGFGRMLFAGSTLVLTATEFDPNFMGSTAKVIFVDPADPLGARVRTLATSSTNFPSPQDVALYCQSRVWVAGFDMGARVFELDVVTGTLVRSVPTMTSQPLGKFQGLGLGADGLLAVGDFVSHQIALIDAARGEWLETIDASALPDAHSQLNEFAFTPAGDRLVAPGHTSDTLAVFEVR